VRALADTCARARCAERSGQRNEECPPLARAVRVWGWQGEEGEAGEEK